MKKINENKQKTNFTKLTHSGISLIVLVITIIVILILAAAIILMLNNNNPIMEANKARYDSDVANMQAVFTNAVAKVMAHNKATVNVTAGQINTRISGVKETTGEVSYIVTDAMNVNNTNGKIVFNKGTNTDTVFYTGKQLPIYAAGDTKWYVDSEGNISLEVAGVKYGNGEIVKIAKVTESFLVDGPTFSTYIPSSTTSVVFTDETMPSGYTLDAVATSSTYVDMSESQNGSIVAWLEGTTFKVSSQEYDTKIKANAFCKYMFQDLRALTNINLEYLDTSYVENMMYMFAYCESLTTLNLSSFDTSNATLMSHMFLDCSSLITLDLSNFKTSNVTYMRSMFSGCSNLAELDLSSFDTSKLEETDRMFQNCNAVVTAYAKTQDDADKFNASAAKPTTWSFVVK